MRWQKSSRSRNLEDRRGGGGMGRAGGIGIGGVVVVLLIALVTKQNPLTLLGALDQGGAPADTVAPINDPAEEPKVLFVSFVFDDAQAMWAELLPRTGTPYRDARLVLFRDRVSSACGIAGSATGPFYCPGDERVFIDLGFYDELAQRFGAPGDFAEAYVLAHEVGHHVQHILGTNRAVAEAAQRRSAQANALSVKLELQADCYAGIWAARAAADGRLEPGDLQEGLGAAAAVGDDRLQRAGTGQVQPESFTHGTSEQRMTWFRRGFDNGDPGYCDTFGDR